jgi:hypothetical protein
MALSEERPVIAHNSEKTLYETVLDLAAVGRSMMGRVQRRSVMTTGKRTLETVIYTALKHAVAENRLDVAEHLLQALEILAEDPERHPSQRHH